MLKDLTKLKEHWGGVSDIVDRWLEERRELLVKYCDLIEIHDFDSANRAHGHKLQSFCEVMVDYVSVGHFEVYEQLAKEAKAFSDSAGLKAGADLVDKIQPSTESVLDFNDKYLETDDLDSLAKDLSVIGEALEQRFESEDKMIEVLHNAHLEQLQKSSSAPA
jgi:regulator of sigma D